jgi:hypothetical protein
MMTPADYISDFVYDKYVRPALERGDETVTLEASEIYDGLNGNYSRFFVCDVLGSQHFRNTYHLALESAEISTDTKYTFRLGVGQRMLA